MHFEDKGLFLSFISYPFFVDGKKLYNETLRDTFGKHKDKLRQYDPTGFHDQYLYKPEGYRMFGSHGLVILSLVDDYVFFHRHFNKNHLQSLLEEDVSSQPHIYDFKSEIISGVTETGGESLEDKAKKSFLLQESRFPFIGIIRMKVDQRLLQGKGNGIETTRRIKDRIDVLSEHYRQSRGCHTKHISIDCFNNDELITIAFSDSLLFLFDFLGEIRSIKNTDVKQEYLEDKEGVKVSFEKHMFGTTFISFGYNVDFHNDENNDSFLQPKNGELKSLKINCLIETKPGHCDKFFEYLKKQKSMKMDSISRNVTGGCNIVTSMTMKKIFDLEKKCQSSKIFHRDVRKIKISIMTPKRYIRSTFDKEAKHSQFTHIQDPIDVEYIGETKRLMKKIGVSKMMRERLLALFELYNRAYQDLLQQLFLDELLPVLRDYCTMMEDMYNGGARIKEIEEAMNYQITYMESACYDRMHHNRHSASLLEYSSGIQQHLTSFDYAYKTIYKAFCATIDPDSKIEPKVYTAVTGAERAASQRTLFMMNINDIIFPELFITAAWKEMANFAFELLLDYEEQMAKTSLAQDVTKLLRSWGKFIKNEESINILKYNLSHSDIFHTSDKVYVTALGLISGELLEYFFKDFIVFHFAFQRDLEKMWYFYLKTLLQTTSVYHHFNEINNKQLIHMLLRLFMVWLLSKTGDNEKDAINEQFITKQASKPFDNIMAKDWVECFVKIRNVTENLFDTLDAYDFRMMSRVLVFNKEQDIKYENMEIRSEDKNKLSKEIEKMETRSIKGLKTRNKTVHSLEWLFEKGELVSANDELVDVDYVICLFQAYMNCLYRLDRHNKIIRTLPRDEKGEVLIIENDSERLRVYDNMIGILSDVTGGFFTPSAQTRKEYFRLRTTLYRSLWNYRFTHVYPNNS